ncbi:hypothetical protein SLEP1_g48567 [Rubroshorea leprosula]|uniref:Uncharacterized protein n=1 Tax=Rubroshorea leprosula TaxID=152421 RepID=A0AAV5LW41_9ROSI|nr:hypothetical protein SLEP1_g48567 [Rubroshorea leprosula]
MGGGGRGEDGADPGEVDPVVGEAGLGVIEEETGDGKGGGRVVIGRMRELLEQGGDRAGSGPQAEGCEPSYRERMARFGRWEAIATADGKEAGKAGRGSKERSEIGAGDEEAGGMEGGG